MYKKKLSLKKNFSWNFIGSFVYSLSQFFILVLLAKLGNPEMVGLYSIGLALTAPIVMLTNLQLRQVQATDTTDEYKFNDYFGLRIIASFFVISLTIIVVYLNSYDLEKSLIIILVAISKIFDSYSDVIYGQLQQRERMDYIGKSRIIKGLLTIIVIGLTLFITNSLFIALIMLNITWFLIFLVYDKKNASIFVNNTRPSFDLPKLKGLVILTFPLGVVMMLGSLNSNLPKIIVERQLGEGALGYFTSISSLVVAGNIFIQAVGQAAAPRLAKLYKEKSYKKFNVLLLKLVSIGILIGLLGTLISTLFGETILTILYDKTYVHYHPILILVMIGGIFSFSNSFIGHAITAMRLFKIQPYIGMISITVIFISSMILIPNFGLEGAALTLIIGPIVEMVVKVCVIIYEIKKGN